MYIVHVRVSATHLGSSWRTPSRAVYREWLPAGKGDRRWQFWKIVTDPCRPRCATRRTHVVEVKVRVACSGKKRKAKVWKGGGTSATGRILCCRSNTRRAANCVRNTYQIPLSELESQTDGRNTVEPGARRALGGRSASLQRAFESLPRSLRQAPPLTFDVIGGLELPMSFRPIRRLPP